MSLTRMVMVATYGGRPLGLLDVAAVNIAVGSSCLQAMKD
jgi:hypothetical protein